MTKSEFIELIELYISRGCRFISFTYRSQGTNELAKVVVNIGVSYSNACKTDNNTLIAMGVSEDEITENARQELIKSVTNPSKTRSEGQDSYIGLAKENAVRFNENTEKLYLFAELHNKNVLEQGVHKVVNSRPLTIKKNYLKKHLKLRTAKFRNYILDNILEREIKMNGEVIEIE